MSNEEMMIVCPKSHQLVGEEECVAIKNLSKTKAKLFSTKICKTVVGCPKEDYCAVFDEGWDSVGQYLERSVKEE